MSDMRFILIGLITVTIGFIVLGVFGAQFTEITVQTKEFSECYKYPEDQPPVRIECDQYLQEKNLLFLLVILIISGGIVALINGIKMSNQMRWWVLEATMIMMMQIIKPKENYPVIQY